MLDLDMESAQGTQSGRVFASDFRENMYNTGVLVGNWYEERMSNQTDPKAIAPALYAQSTCINDKSNYMDSFLHPLPLNSADGTKSFMDTKLDAFRNKLTSTTSNINLEVDSSYLRNMTTLKDIQYRLEPKQDREAVYHTHGVPPKKVDIDHTKSYGNQTETGLLNWMRCERARYSYDRPDMSLYKKTFVKPKMTRPPAPMRPVSDPCKSPI